MMRDPIVRFTKREKSVLPYLLDGTRPKQIAKLLHLSHGGVNNIISKIGHKLGAQSRTESAAVLQKQRAQALLARLGQVERLARLVLDQKDNDYAKAALQQQLDEPLRIPHDLPPT